MILWGSLLVKKHFNKTLKLSELPAKFIWDNHESAVLFRNALNTTAARESINIFRFKTYEYNNVGINYTALDLTNICKKAADIAMIPCRRHKAKGKKKKRGTIFEKTCAIVEKEIKLLCRRVNENPFDKQLKQKYYAKKKERRKLLKHNSKIMKQKMVSQLNQLHDENPRGNTGT